MVRVIGTIATITTTPSGQYIDNRIAVTTMIWTMLSIRNSSPKDRNCRIADRSFITRESSWPDCQLPWKDIGSTCSRA